MSVTNGWQLAGRKSNCGFDPFCHRTERGIRARQSCFETEESEEAIIDVKYIQLNINKDESLKVALAKK